MITKTYLDGKLNQLEEKIKRTIDVKDNRQTEKINAEIGELRNAIKEIEEKAAENRDMLENYLKEHGGAADSNDLRELKQPTENFQETGSAEDMKKKDNNNDDVITSDI